jgi:hypothetical protein
MAPMSSAKTEIDAAALAAFLPKIIPVIEALTTLQRRFGVFGWKQVSD